MATLLPIPDPVAGIDVRNPVRVDVRRRTEPSGAPPLVLLGGMTQTLASWAGQIRPLSEGRDVIAYEARGQGATDLALDDCTMGQHVRDLEALLEALEVAPPVDLCGFSFGGQVALAVAATAPGLVRKLVCTGVARSRGVVGRLIVQGWLATLETGDLHALARVSLPDILGPAYLEKHEHLVEAMVRAAAERNRFAGVAALMRTTVEPTLSSAGHMAGLAATVTAPSLCIGGELDRLAPMAEVRALADLLHGEHRIVPNVGHTVPIEAPEAWREIVVEFLDR